MVIFIAIFSLLLVLSQVISDFFIEIMPSSMTIRAIFVSVSITDMLELFICLFSEGKDILQDAHEFFPMFLLHEHDPISTCRQLLFPIGLRFTEQS